MEAGAARQERDRAGDGAAAPPEAVLRRAAAPPDGVAAPARARRFLFLQGPHGPFFAALARRLRAAGAEVLRVGFNAGDRAFWPDGTRYIAYRGTPEGWPEACAALLAQHRITDLVLYGDTRPVHARALALARAAGLRTHVFEEGYLRPYWVTYERGGANAHSPLMQTPTARMAAALAGGGQAAPDAPARWGDTRQHIFYGAAYHACVLLANRGYRGFRPHRTLSVRQEFRLHLKRLLLRPVLGLARARATRRIRQGGFGYDLVLLQLAHDESLRHHSPYARMEDFLAEVLAAFAAGAPPAHHLVFKAHPLEDGRMPLPRRIRSLARAAGLAGRVHFVPGGKLAALLDGARCAVTINSTAAQQALWRGLPVRAMGRAVYARPGLVSQQPLAEFFAAPDPPDPASYRVFRAYLLATSQIPGGFYSARGRRQLLARIVALMLAPQDPYVALEAAGAARAQQLRRVS